jgi:hypothetical protein
MLDRYREAITNTVCVQCLQRTGQGTCGLTGVEECPILRHLPDVVSIVTTIDSTMLHDYVHEFHNVICVSCRDNVDGQCALRGSYACELDAFFPLIVETIKEVQGKESAGS